MRLPRTSTSIFDPETPRTMASAPNVATNTVSPTAGGRSSAAGASARGVRVDRVADRAERRARLGAASVRHRRSTPPGVAGRPAAIRQCVRLLLQPSDDAIDFDARVAQLLVDLVVEPPLEHRFALGETRLAVEQRVRDPRASARRSASALALAWSSAASSRSTRARCAASCDSRPDRRARASAMTVAGMPSRSAISSARLRPGAP